MRAACSLLVASLALGCRRDAPAAPPGTAWLAGAEAHWQGWIELVPAVRTPRFRDQRDRTVVYARLPPGAQITLRDPADRRSLQVPAGSELDRVESFKLRGALRVVDVRGTAFTAAGERFHVFRPVDDRGGGLFGVSWPRAEAPPLQAQTAMTDAMRAGLGLAGVHLSRHPRAIRRFEGLLRCAGCHRAMQPTRAGAPDEWPRRETDASGLYSLLATLRDDDVVETYRPLDLNRGAPFTRETLRDDGLRAVSFATAEAMRAGDPHARAICVARRRLSPHLHRAVRAAFRAELTACGVDVDSR